MVTGDTQVLGIIGWPVAHSRSPAMHNAALGERGIDAVYVPLPVPPERLEQAVRGLVALGVRGVNVTLPHKEAIGALLDEVEPDARAIGAVNTVVREGERLLGTNTDAPGLVRSLEEAGVALEGANAMVVGSGGAARASVVGLGRAGVARIVVAARRPDAAQAMLDELDDAVGGARTEALALDDERGMDRSLSGAGLLVQATSATLDDGPDAAALAASLPLDALPASAAVVDLVYRPRETAVLRAARERGLQTVDGLGMLLHQGTLAFERWTGEPAPVEVMREALLNPEP